MSDPTLLVALASTGTAGIAITAAAGLKTWEGWLELRRSQLNPKAPCSLDHPPMELNRLRERVRRLEAIANGSSS